MKFIKQAFGEYNKFNMKRFCLSYDLFTAILPPSKVVNFDEKNCIVVTDVVMTLFVPAKRVLLVPAENVM